MEGPIGLARTGVLRAGAHLGPVRVRANADRDRAGGRGPVPELPHLVVSPAIESAVRPACARVAPAGAHLGPVGRRADLHEPHARRGGAIPDLSLGVGPVTPESSVRLDPARMKRPEAHARPGPGHPGVARVRRRIGRGVRAVPGRVGSALGLPPVASVCARVDAPLSGWRSVGVRLPASVDGRRLVDGRIRRGTGTGGTKHRGEKEGSQVVSRLHGCSLCRRRSVPMHHACLASTLARSGGRPSIVRRCPQSARVHADSAGRWRDGRMRKRAPATVGLVRGASQEGPKRAPCRAHAKGLSRGVSRAWRERRSDLPRDCLATRDFAAPTPGRTLALVWRKRSPLGAPLRELARVMRGAAKCLESCEARRAGKGRARGR
jgi:hypothetical protein